MSGHSKWSKIKHQKAVTDVKKSKIFTKLVRNISVEAKKAKGDRNAPGLRLAIEKARQANMPGDNVERAIDKASASAEMERILYEAYGPGGVAILIDTLTDSRNRTNQEIKHLLAKHGGSAAGPGAASWAFAKNADGVYEPTSTVDLSDEELSSLALLVEALEEYDDVQDVFTNAA